MEKIEALQMENTALRTERKAGMEKIEALQLKVEQQLKNDHVIDQLQSRESDLMDLLDSQEQRMGRMLYSLDHIASLADSWRDDDAPIMDDEDDPGNGGVRPTGPKEKPAAKRARGD
jgi:hypothetical protein